MNPDERLASIVAALESVGLTHLVMGGHAVRFYGLQRNTTDFDLHLSPQRWDELPERLSRTALFSGRPVIEGASWRRHTFRRFEIGRLPAVRPRRRIRCAGARRTSRDPGAATAFLAGHFLAGDIACRRAGRAGPAADGRPGRPAPPHAGRGRPPAIPSFPTDGRPPGQGGRPCGPAGPAVVLIPLRPTADGKRGRGSGTHALLTVCRKSS